MSRLGRIILFSLVVPLAFAQPDNNLVYQIFVRSFADTPSDAKKPADKGETGDFRGISEKLDYLNDGKPETDNDLEAGILWLMPIFPSRSYHGYDIVDYNDVNPDYGTLQDLDGLIKEAHKRGLRIILDIAFNHTSNEHKWFKQAVEDPSSPFRKFYHFSDIDQPAPAGSWHVATASNGKQVRYLGLFSPSMPDLNLSVPEVNQQVKAIAKFWMDRGIDGFRLDAAKHVFGDTFGDLPEQDILRNNDWWREFSDFVYGINSKAVLVGEVLGSHEALRRHSFGNDALLDEPFMDSARSWISSPRAGFLKDWVAFVRSCRDVNANAHGAFPRQELFHSFPYLASHDKDPRLASFLEKRKAEGMQATVDEAYRLGLYLLTSIGKYPILYNGDELMQPGFKWNGNPSNHATHPGDGSGIYDETLREPFPWRKSGNKAPQTGWFPPRFDKPNDGVSVAEQSSSRSMLSLTRALTNLRTRHPAYASGEVGEILNDDADWLVFEKTQGNQHFLVMINSTGQGRDYNFHQGWFPQYIGAQLLFWSDGRGREWKHENSRIENKVFVPPYGFVLLRRNGA